MSGPGRCEEPLGLYCHVPFCPRPCDYCGFYRFRPTAREIAAYLDGVQLEIERSRPDRSITTVFFGGGTPGMLTERDLRRLGELVRGITRGAPSEWTVELGPSTVRPEKIRLLRDLGVNRFSLGVQSFNLGLLGKIGRCHTPDAARRAFDILRDEGADNVNVDLIIALPEQSLSELTDDLDSALRLAPEHISTYCLTLEEDTALRERIEDRGGAIDQEREADHYLRTWSMLEEAGYRHYEISNFAKPGHECLHNLHTWMMHEWIGLGPSAATQYHGVRCTNPPGIEKWLAGLRCDEPALVDVQPLTTRMLIEDTIIFGLRTRDGVCPEAIQMRWHGEDLSFLDPLWHDLERVGMLFRERRECFHLTQKGMLLADQIALEVLAAFDRSYSVEDSRVPAGSDGAGG